MTSRFPLFALLDNPVDLTFLESDLQYVGEMHAINIIIGLDTGIA